MTPRYMLDTNICVRLIKNKPEEVLRRFERCRVGEIVISAVTYCELEYGVAMSVEREHDAANLAALIELITVAPLNRSAGILYGPIRSISRKRRPRVLDTLIVAHAVALNVPLVTSNADYFKAYPAVKVENWLEAA
jgi:tRNA(fMet)-specific endonuclease VapC